MQSHGTCTQNGHHRDIVIAVSSESGLCVSSSTFGVHKASHIPAHYHLSDDEPAMVEGVTRACNRAGINEPRGSCSVHLTENEMPDNKKLLKKSTNFDKFKGYIIARQPLAPPINRIAVAAVIKEWKKKR